MLKWMVTGLTPLNSTRISAIALGDCSHHFMQATYSIAAENRKMPISAVTLMLAYTLAALHIVIECLFHSYHQMFKS
jgi:hypothetical protein